MPVIGATELQPINILGSYVQGLEGARANKLAEQQLIAAQQKADREARVAEETILTQRATRAKNEADMAAAESERKIKASQQLADYLATAKDQGSFRQLRDSAAAAGMDVSRVPENFDPLWVANTRRSALGYTKFLENERAERGLRVQEGQLQQSQARLKFDQNVENWKRTNPEYDIKETALGFIAVNKRNPSDTRLLTGGDNKPLTGAVSQKATEDQLKTAYNADRMLSAGEVISNALKANPTAEKPGFWEATVGATPFIRGAVNFVRDEERQQIAAAQVQLADALLYLATGAAYNKLQYDNNQEAVIPQFSDKASTIRTKRKLFLDQVEAAKRRSASAWTPEHESIYKNMLQMYDAPLAPPPSAARDLLADPSPAAQKEFDEIFGEGAAAKLIATRK